MSKNLLAYLGILFTVTAWGASFIATKVALRYVSPIAIIWLRFTLGVLVLGSVVILRKQRFSFNTKDLLYLALLGFIGVAFHTWIQATALLTTTASTTAWIITTTPVFMALLGYIFLGEKLGWLKSGGIFLASFGVLAVVSKGGLDSLWQGTFGNTGDLLAILSAINWAIFSILSKPGLKKFPATIMLFYVMVLGWFFITLVFIGNNGFTEIKALHWEGWFAICFLGILCSGLAYIFWYDGLQTIPSAQVGVFLNLEPLVAMLVAAAILHEKIYATSIIGGIFILLGISLVNKPIRSASFQELPADETDKP